MSLEKEVEDIYNDYIAAIKTKKTLWKELNNEKKKLKIRNNLLKIMKDISFRIKKDIEIELSALTTKTLNSLGFPYQIKFEFRERGGSTECKIDIPKYIGGGVRDIISFCIRMTLISILINQKRTSPIIIADEPFKHLKGHDSNLKMIDAVKVISKKLGIQFILVYDERFPISELSNVNLINITKKQGESVVNYG